MNLKNNWLLAAIVLFQVPFSRSDIDQLTEDMIQFSMYEYHTASYLERLWKMHTWTRDSLGFGLKICESMLKNKQLMATLRDAAFDAALLDPMSICGDLVVDVLGLPLIVSIRFSFGAVLERHCGHVPAPPSFVPPPPLPYSDRMTFTERLVSVLMYVATSVVSEVVWRWTMGNFYSEIKGWSSSREANHKQISLTHQPCFLSEQEVRAHFVRPWRKRTSGWWETSGTWRRLVRPCPTSNTWAVSTANQPVLSQRHESTSCLSQWLTADGGGCANDVICSRTWRPSCRVQVKLESSWWALALW